MTNQLKATAKPLTARQRCVLDYLRQNADGQTATWIAEGNGKFRQPEWAYPALSALLKRGLVRKIARGMWGITDAGIEALRAGR